MAIKLIFLSSRHKCDLYVVFLVTLVNWLAPLWSED